MRPIGRLTKNYGKKVDNGFNYDWLGYPTEQSRTNP